MLIERANINDAEAIARFQVAMAKESENTILDKNLVTRGVTEALNDKNKGMYLVARNDEGLPVASLMITREWSDWRCTWYWWIQSVYVRPEYRRRGIYKAMYNKVKAMAKDENVLHINLYVDRENKAAISTYQSLGMTESHYLMYEEHTAPENG